MVNNNPFGIETIDEAQTLVEMPEADSIQANFDFYYGDHWQNGAAWSGPIPDSSESEYADIAAEIQRGLNSKNVVKEITDRATNAVTGRLPVWDVIPNRVITDDSPITDEEQARIDEAKLLLQNWMEEKEFTKFIAKAVRQTLLAGRATLRLFVPAGYVRDGQLLIDTNNPLDNLYLDAPHPLSGTVSVDDNSKEKVAIFLGQIGETETAELSYLLPVATENGRVTEITLIIGKGNLAEVQNVQLDLGGRLPMYQMKMPRLITEQITSLQKGLNLNLTMMQRNSVLGGFLERVILNGQLPGHYETDPDTGEDVFVRDDFAVGAGTVNAIQGNPVTDTATGQITNYSSASMVYKDPVSPDTFLKAADSIYRMMLESSDQLHALISGDAAASGESRRQAVASFFAYLKTPKRETDKAGRWTLETVLAYAAFFSGDSSKFKGLKVTFDSKLDKGATPTAEIDLIERLVRIGIISIETAREMIGVENPAIEANRVEKEKRSNLLATSGVQTQEGTSAVTGVSLTNINNDGITGSNAEEGEQ